MTAPDPRLPADAAPPPGWAVADVVTRLRRALRSSVRGEIAWERLPMAQVELLQRLVEQPGLRISVLAQRHRLATNTVSNLVQAMVDSRLVERTPDPADRRAVVVSPTVAGREALDAWQAANSRRLQAALEALPADDQRTILAVLPALGRLVDELERGSDG